MYLTGRSEMRNRLVILEGANGSGKSTIRPIVARLLGQHGDHVIDRFVASYYVMDQMHGRKNPQTVENLLEQLHDLQLYCYEVFHVTLIGTPAEMLRRLTYRGPHNETIQSLERQQDLFSEFDRILESKTVVWRCQTGAFDHEGPNMVAQIIADWVNEHDRRPT